MYKINRMGEGGGYKNCILGNYQIKKEKSNVKEEKTRKKIVFRKPHENSK